MNILGIHDLIEITIVDRHVINHVIENFLVDEVTQEIGKIRMSAIPHRMEIIIEMNLTETKDLKGVHQEVEMITATVLNRQIGGIRITGISHGTEIRV